MNRLARLALALTTMAAAALPAMAEPHQKHGPVVIRFEQTGQGHIVIPVTIAGVKAHAILDNGAFTTVIDQKFAEDHGLTNSAGPTARAMLKQVLGGYDLGRSVTVTLSGVDEEVTPVLVDLDTLQNDDDDVIAIVGEEVFDRHIVSIDFYMKTVTLTDRSDFRPPMNIDPIPVKSMLGSAKLRIPISLEGAKPFDAIIDLGAGASLVVRDNATTQGWLKDGRKWAPLESRVVRGDKMVGRNGRLTTAKSVTIGQFTLSNVPVNVGGFDMLGFMDALIGMDILGRFDLIFDVPQKQIWLKPHENFDRPFRRLVVGVSWKPPMTDGALEVDSVMRGSPAQKAGLKEGDIVARLNGKAATRGLFSALKAGERATLELANGARMTFIADNFY
jgi:hypothetical protein